MSLKEQEPRSDFGAPTWYGDQDENGVDLSLIRELLKLTPIERLRRMDKATSDAIRLRQHGKESR